MAPKGRDQPKAAKVAVDKTFGMKNKKGGAAQKHIKQLEASTASKSDDQKRKDALKEAKAKELAAAELARKEAAELFKPVQVQKVPIGVDPKSVLCQFFKKGACEKGKRCKFSHDLAIERKAEKKGLYDVDEEKEKANAEEEAKKRDDMADWDEEKLRSVVLSKQGNPKTTTDKVCKFFIEAVENGKYGWFWVCLHTFDRIQVDFRLITTNRHVRTEAQNANTDTHYHPVSCSRRENNGWQKSPQQKNQQPTN